jgi:hypothetical protein
MEPVFCACGCGQQLEEKKWWKSLHGYRPRFIKNHHWRAYRKGLPKPDFIEPKQTVCACGCGGIITEKRTHKYGAGGTYLPGHHVRVDGVKRGRKRVVTPKPEQIPSGICECGCGEKTEIADRTDAKSGVFFGYPRRFIKGHSGRVLTKLSVKRGKDNPNWKGGKSIRGGYVEVHMPEHPRADKAGNIREHRLVMEQVLGRPLERHEIVHHKNGIKDDNRPENLELWKLKDPPGVRASDYHCAGCDCKKRRLDKSPED